MYVQVIGHGGTLVVGNDDLVSAYAVASQVDDGLFVEKDRALALLLSGSWVRWLGAKGSYILGCVLCLNADAAKRDGQ